jgi:hypothetical protein
MEIFRFFFDFTKLIFCGKKCGNFKNVHLSY